jgi:hypothetical protein
MSQLSQCQWYAYKVCLLYFDIFSFWCIHVVIIDNAHFRCLSKELVNLGKFVSVPLN